MREAKKNARDEITSLYGSFGSLAAFSQQGLYSEKDYAAIIKAAEDILKIAGAR